MLFHSTRGKDSNKTFEEVLMQGLASDGGLFMPNEWPQVDISKLKEMNSFIEIAKYIVPLYTKSSFTDEQVQKILDNTWHSFSDSNLAKIKELDDAKIILELFHGPTAAFKDFGLQLAASFFNESLIRSNKTAIVLGATSGDTGSAAIDSCKRFDSIKSFILLPEGNMSEVQRRQMTTVNSDNVFVLKVNGTFDDCQNIVKEAFKVRSFLKNDQYLLAVNSINWVRLLPQIVYYFYSALKIGVPDKEIVFSVPTGNFGNILAGWMAKKIGLPISKLICASNQNDILTRFFNNGTMERKNVLPSYSPSMDIQVSSNFERLLYEINERDTNKVKQQMKDFKSNGNFEITKNQLKKINKLFSAYMISDEETLELINKVYSDYNYILDPHSAIGYGAAQKALDNNIISKDMSVISLACAHPAKFPEIISKSINVMPKKPSHLENIMSSKEYFNIMDPNINDVQNFIKSNMRN